MEPTTNRARNATRATIASSTTARSANTSEQLAARRAEGRQDEAGHEERREGPGPDLAAQPSIGERAELVADREEGRERVEVRPAILPVVFIASLVLRAARCPRPMSH